MVVQELKNRRNKILNKMENDSAMILFSGVSKLASGDDSMYKFVVNRNFFYLTDIEQENSALLFIKTDSDRKVFLFISEYDPVKEKWYGKRYTPDEAKQKTGIDNVVFINSLDAKIAQVLNRTSSDYGILHNLYVDKTPEIKISDAKSVKDFEAEIKEKYSDVKIMDANSIIIPMRMVKSAEEIKMIRESISVTNLGIKAILNSIEPGIYEYQLAALFEYIIKDYINARISFDSIVASGANATILHYPNPLSKVKDGSLVLFDIGAELFGYHADISRTFPCSKTYNPLQRSIYQIVLDCNKAVIAMIKPGITIAELQQFALEFMADALVKEGLMHNRNDILKYYYHNISHHLGLDTHDASIRSLPLASGNVITVEPGLYFKEYGIGIRIEDDVLVTETGSENLSKEIIKEINDIEIALKHKNTF